MVAERSILIADSRTKLAHQEYSPLRTWFMAFSDILNQRSDDSTFRLIMRKDNPYGLWTQRPPELTVLDHVRQEWPHKETVGNHIHTVLQNLRTEFPLNGINYLSTRPAMIKVVRAAALLHDVAKKSGPYNHNHPFESAQESERYLEWMGFDTRQIRLCLHLIAHHDMIGRAVNRSAKESVSDIVRLCETPAVLQCLYALTIADISSIEGLMKIPHILEDSRTLTMLAYPQIVSKRNGSVHYSFPTTVLARGFEPLTSRL